MSSAPLRASPQKERVPRFGPMMGVGARRDFANRSMWRPQTRPHAPVRAAGESRARETRGSRERVFARAGPESSAYKLRLSPILQTPPGALQTSLGLNQVFPGADIFHRGPKNPRLGG